MKVLNHSSAWGWAHRPGRDNRRSPPRNPSDFPRHGIHRLPIVQRDGERQLDIVPAAVCRGQAIPGEDGAAPVGTDFQPAQRLPFAVDRVISLLL